MIGNGPVTGMRGNAFGRRWCFMSPFRVGRNFDRLRLVQTPWFGIYVHVIRSPDADPDLHNHPWGFASLVLSGGYTEHVWDTPGKAGTAPREATRARGSLHVMRRSQAHRIVKVDGLLWTLFFTGPHHGEWGWWVTEGDRSELVPWHICKDVKDPDALVAERLAL